MNKLIASVLLATALPVALSAAIPLDWEVEVTKSEPSVFYEWQGGDYDFKAALKRNGKPFAIDLQDTVEPRLYWQTNGMDYLYWSVPASVEQIQTMFGPQTVFRGKWTPEMETGNQVYNCFLGITGTIYNAAFQMKLRKSPGVHPNDLPLPRAIIDFDRTEVRNAPWPVEGTARMLPPYLHLIEFDDTYPDAAQRYYDRADYSHGGCSVRRVGNTLERNYDWNFDEMAEFVVRVSSATNRYASIGVANVGTNLTERTVTRGEWSPYYKALPGHTLDGVNECGVVAEINVTSTDGVSGWTTNGTVHCLGAVRWALDHGSSARSAALQLAEKVYVPADFGMNFHYLLADADETWIVENGEAHLVTNAVAVMTNFDLYRDDPDGAGRERYDILTNGVNGITNAWFTRCYARDTDPKWISEFHGDEAALAAAIDYWNNGNTRESHRGESLGGETWWQTVHTSVYDISNKVMRVAVQENDDWYTFALSSGGGGGDVRKSDVLKIIAETSVEDYPEAVSNSVLGRVTNEDVKITVTNDVLTLWDKTNVVWSSESSGNAVALLTLTNAMDFTEVNPSSVVGRVTNEDVKLTVTNGVLYIYDQTNMIWRSDAMPFSETDPTVADWAKKPNPKPVTDLTPATNYTDEVVADATAFAVKSNATGTAEIKSLRFLVDAVDIKAADDKSLIHRYQDAWSALGGSFSGRGSVAVGEGAASDGNGSTAFGNNAQATTTSATALGRAAEASGTSSVAVGVNVTASGNRSVAIGAGATATNASSIVVSGSTSKYYSHGNNTVNIGVTDNPDNVYFKHTTLTEMIRDKALAPSTNYTDSVKAALESEIAAHATSTNAHEDIRKHIETKVDAYTVDSDYYTLDDEHDYPLWKQNPGLYISDPVYRPGSDTLRYKLAINGYDATFTFEVFEGGTWVERMSLPGSVDRDTLDVIVSGMKITKHNHEVYTDTAPKAKALADYAIESSLSTSATNIPSSLAVSDAIEVHDSSDAAHSDIRTAAANAQAHSEATRQIVSTWEGFLDGSNVVFSITNYISGAYSLDEAKLKIQELKEVEPGVTNYVTVFDSRTEITNHTEAAKRELYGVVNSTAAVLRAELVRKADVDWGKYTSDGAPAPSNTVVISAPSTVFAGGHEFERINVGTGTVGILSNRGAMTYTGEPGTFRFRDAITGEYFGYTKNTYTLGVNTDGIQVDSATHMVTLTYNVTMSTYPIVKYVPDLEDFDPEEWEPLNDAMGNPIPGASHVIAWEDPDPEPGKKVCHINCADGRGFFTAEIAGVDGDCKFETNMAADLKGGIVAQDSTDTNVVFAVEAYVESGEVKWRIK